MFRGILLGLLLHQGLSVPAGHRDPGDRCTALATRLWVKGRSRGMLFIDLVIAVVGGWLVVETLGIGAAVVGPRHHPLRVFLATGHAGQARPVGWEPEEVAGRALPPKGWDLAGEDTGSQAVDGASVRAAGSRSLVRGPVTVRAARLRRRPGLSRASRLGAAAGHEQRAR